MFAINRLFVLVFSPCKKFRFSYILRAPPGCQRYMMEETGKIISYNFGVVSGATRAAAAQNAGVELSMQRYVTFIFNTTLRNFQNI